MRHTALALAFAVAAACGEPSPGGGGEPDAGSVDVDAESDASVECPGAVTIVAAVTALAGVGRCSVELQTPAPTIVEVAASGAELSWGAPGALDEPSWIAPRVVDAGPAVLEVEASGPWTLDVSSYGAPVDEVRRERSLAWVEPALLDDASLVGLGRLMTAAANGAGGAALFDWWLARFATTAHSERVGPARFIAALEAEHGSDPAQWDLDALPFRVTGVHNRLDLANGTHCGELRVSIASTHAEFQPFHAIFLFAQPPGPGDVSPGGTVHCGGTARRWAGLSTLDDAGFVEAARAWLVGALTPANFLMVETVEFIISPWEWRQWLPVANTDASGPPRVLENPPLFQTLDAARINAGGGLRTEFLRFVADNAAALDARTLEFPERYRPLSARVNAGVPWVPLDLDGLDPAITADLPNLRQNLEIVGCPACHATDADFIQTRVDRTFSPFYDKELDARAGYLEARHRGEVRPTPFGPLQDMPRLPP